jgi:arabinose-5-phosphate isomerase
MGMPKNRPVRQDDPATSLRRIQCGQEVLCAEARIVNWLAEHLNDQFALAVDRVLQCRGQVIVSGIGKAGIIGRKLSASLTSTGTSSHFLHPAEAVHGDLGCVGRLDCVVMLSYSGETEEVVRLLPTLRNTAECIIAITASSTSTLGRQADIILQLGYHQEACGMGLAPSTTTTGMLALCDALTITVSQERGFTRDQFAKNHPAGNLGRQLMNVCDAMRPLAECRVADQNFSVRQVMIQVSRPGRRTGAVMMVDSQQKLVGIFTDSDLARLLERCEDQRLDQPISQVMTKRFHTVDHRSRLSRATELMARLKISELPVVDDAGRPLGLVDLTDIVGVVANCDQLNCTSTEEPAGGTSSADTDLGGSIDSPRIIPFDHRR